MTSVQFSSDIVNSNVLNKEKDPSCKNQDGSGGRIWSGFKYGRDETGYRLEHAKCSNLKLEENVYDLQKGTEFQKVCDCEMVEGKNGSIECPNDKFLGTYYPLLNKGSCCKPCNNDGKVKVSIDQKNCFPVVKGKDDTEISCPDKLFMKNMNFVDGTAKIECCAPKFEGETVEKQNIVIDDCTKMKIPKELCSNEFMNTLKTKCKEYGITECDYETVRNVESKCNSYGMRYFDTLENKYKNTDSPIICHVDNFNKLDGQCVKGNVSSCSVYNLMDNQSKDVVGLKKDITNIDKIQTEYDQKFNNLENSLVNKLFGNKVFVVLSSIICLIIIAIIAYVLINKKTQK
ncbi:hypothetical protein QKU48_gp0768 [Fadolivirus algeromassiliense]|jgi:hypothetical protein|uniref:Uncharacterized protein n=1 Tax=Fadolivirus FV1/VV64 TaxID=3070911 RepID=A0A7D3QW68_9VIRU|nr:hypothetical protein QKU48_gp0768 [Fadolivirus algeromassiliense]QKF94226.1 hypothetical protein Fadolivirus_1_768 [Fadolivirus FV1/VV64]